MIPLSVFEIAALGGFCDARGRDAGIGCSKSWMQLKQTTHVKLGYMGIYENRYENKLLSNPEHKMDCSGA